MTAAALEAHLQRLVDTHRFPGLSFAVHSRDSDRPLFLYEAGTSDLARGTPFKRDTVVDTASVSKALVVVLAQQLVETGLHP